MIRYRFTGLISCCLLLLSVKCMSQNSDTRFVEDGIHALNEVLIHDITSPLLPVEIMFIP